MNLGDHYGFHGGALSILRDAAPLVILHDAWMGNFVHNWQSAVGREHSLHVASFLDGLGGDESGIAPLCGLASGVVVHSAHYRGVVEAACPGPVMTIPLSHTSEALSPPRPIGEHLIVTTIGHVNKNRRADEVIRALGSSERLRDRVRYMLVGPVESDQKAHLLALACQVGAPAPHFTGWVPDDVLRLLMAGTDVFCCLRYPALEGASGSLIFSLLSGRPTLVSNHASYAEIPDGLVMKCTPGQEAADVACHLETVLDAPDAAQSMGRQAREFALENFAPATYATRLLQALDAATRAEPAIRVARMIGRQLAQLGMKADDPSVERMDKLLDSLLCGTG